MVMEKERTKAKTNGRRTQRDAKLPGEITGKGNRAARRRINRQWQRLTLLGENWSRNGIKQLKDLIPRAVDPSASIGFARHFTAADAHPYDAIEFERVDVEVKNWRDNSISFFQEGVEKPVGMSVNAAHILAQKYLRYAQGTPEREWSMRQVVDRMVDPVVDFGWETGYYATTDEREAHRSELKHLFITQKAAPNSPVWFNIGVKDVRDFQSGKLVPQQASACFILKVGDSRVSLAKWIMDEQVIFYGGSGSGVNTSNVRGAGEPLKRGGVASGPIPYEMGADSVSNAIKSGGTTRRAAKMWVMNDDHPDIEEFIETKQTAEWFNRAAKAMGYDVDIDGRHYGYVNFQNANNSFRATDEFMEAVEADADWHLRARVGGHVVKTLKARDLFHQMMVSAWECADPGMQYDTTVNDMHTLSNINRINASNPCSEYMSEDESACNLASFNLLKFLGDDDTFDVEGFRAGVRALIMYQEILVGYADYPTEGIAINANKHRQLGIGYANLGALLMALGLAYDSDGGRAWAACITALLTGEAYRTSALAAKRMGAFVDCDEPMHRVLEKHRASAYKIDARLVPDYLIGQSQEVWDDAVKLGRLYGVRNSQASVLAPTGTIGLVMDCDTTGVEPDLGLVKFKKLVGGGSMTIVNQTIPRGLTKLGYTAKQVVDIQAYIEKNQSVLLAPHLNPDHYPVFACSMGDNPIQYMGHVKMMAAVQPFISGAISKTVNLPEEVTVEEMKDLHIQAWKLGIKAIAVYRDNCKAAQPLSTGGSAEDGVKLMVIRKILESASNAQFMELMARLFHERFNPTHDWNPDEDGKRHLPFLRPSITYHQEINDANGIIHDHYIHWGLGPDGKPLEEFVAAGKAGSAYRGTLDMKAITQSEAFKRGQRIESFISRYLWEDYEPKGRTPDPEIGLVHSHQDGLARLASMLYETPEQQAERGVMTRAAKAVKAKQLSGETNGSSTPPVYAEPAKVTASSNGSKAPRKALGRVTQCSKCGSTNIQDGPCPTCMDCGQQQGGCTG